MQRLSHIVMIDDSEIDLFFHEILLKSAGFTGELTALKSVDDALAYFQNIKTVPPDLILLDLNLPGINGIELIQLLASNHPELWQSTVVVVSSSSLPEDIELALQCKHVQGYCTKPLAVPHVLQIHDDVLHRRGLSTACCHSSIFPLSLRECHSARMHSGDRYGGTDTH